MNRRGFLGFLAAVGAAFGLKVSHENETERELRLAVEAVKAGLPPLPVRPAESWFDFAGDTYRTIVYRPGTNNGIPHRDFAVEVLCKDVYYQEFAYFRTLPSDGPTDVLKWVKVGPVMAAMAPDTGFVHIRVCGHKKADEVKNV